MTEAVSMTEEELLELEREIRSDPIRWAYWKLKDPKGNPWRARWYQKEIIDGIMEGDRRIAARMGRRVGKTETMVVFCLWYAFHHENSRLLIVAPYEHQVRMIFMRLEELIRDCDELRESVSTTKNPFIASFGNGSKILGFTAGATSGAHAGASLRGQRADWIFIDEIDYMSRQAIDATIAISYEDPKRIGIWVSSTPTGKRDFFYEVCTNPETGYKAYHFPSRVNPDFDEKMEAEMRATMTEQGFVHEVLAEFGEETVGVFNKEFIDRAKNQYIYSYRELNIYEKEQYQKVYDLDKVVYIPEFTVSNPAPPAIRCVGVDWDKMNDATQIVVTEFDEVFKKFKVVKRYEIPRGEFTFDNAVKKIIELNEIWNPKFIYVDAGHGEYQIETLRKHGLEHPETELHRKVKRIHFSESIEVRDPATREIDKKDAKSFMVNQTAIVLERDQILLSPFDDLIWKQMQNYQVVKRTAHGKPIYTSEYDHALDALMLTILAFTLEFPEITKILEEVRVARKAYRINSNEEERLKKQLFDRDKDIFDYKKAKRLREPRDNPRWHWERVPLGYTKRKSSAGLARGISLSSKNQFRRSRI